jgi:hypothetical protein
MAAVGNYEVAGIYYEGVVQQIHKLLIGISDPTWKEKWQLVSNGQMLPCLSTRECLLFHLQEYNFISISTVTVF